MRKNELKFFEDMLLERKVQITKNIEESSKGISSLTQHDVGDEVDHASVSTDRMIEEAISQQLNKELHEIEYALGKISAGTYGICEMCEEDISFQRLKVKVHAKYCITCREIIEESANKN
jgi:DnaK suppressor protein